MAALQTRTMLRHVARATTQRSVLICPPRIALQALRPYSTESSSAGPDSGKASSDNSKSASGASWLPIGVGILSAAGLGAYLVSDEKSGDPFSKFLGLATTYKPTPADYQKVYNAIAAALEKDESYDDGSYGPVLVRLAWHASGTYDAKTDTGGSNGATMRFAPESDHGANAGLAAARDFMEEIHKKFPWISYSDLWTLGGVVAIQEMGGPQIAWRPGRSDREAAFCTPDGRLPDADKDSNHLRAIFYRMGFNDQEIVALSGAHALGRCHRDRSGFDGPWQHAPTSFTNVYYDLLLHEKWGWRKWDGPKQYQDKSTGALMMLPTDMALIQDRSFRRYVEKYAKDEDTFFNDFAEAFGRLLELGVPAENFAQSASGGTPLMLKTTAEQDL